MHLAPNGSVFYSGPEQATRFLDTSGSGAWTAGPSRKFGYRDAGTAVMYDEGKVLTVGGGGGSATGAAPTATAEVIDLVAGTGWRYTNPMAFGRRHVNATLLPDGKVLVTGGTGTPGFNDARGSVLAAEVWDPETEAWTTLASMSVRRLYHSTALLLPDGRVLSAGGGRPAGTGLNPADTNHPDAELFSPPYLFNADGTPATRPAITSAPASAGYGETFFVGTPDPGRIAKVNWIRLSSVTHSWNQDQRINRLTFSAAAGGVNVTAPANGKLCPPGHYMLFLLDGNGVPSVARVVRVG